MTNEVKELIGRVHDMAESCSDVAGCIQDEIYMLIDEDCDLTPNECATLEQMEFSLSRMSVDIDCMWSKLLKILEQNTEFYKEMESNEGND